MKKIVILLLMFFSTFIVGVNVSASSDDNVFNDNSSIEADFKNLGMDISIYQPYYLLEDEEYKKPYVVAFSEHYVDEHYLKNYIYLYVAKYDENIFGDDNDYRNTSEGIISFSMNGNKYNSSWTICKTDYNHNIIKLKINSALYYDDTNVSRIYDFESIKIINSKLIDDSYENVYDDTEYNFDLDFNGEVDCNSNKVKFKYDSFCIIDRKKCFSFGFSPEMKYNFFERMFCVNYYEDFDSQLFMVNFDLPLSLSKDISKILSIDFSYNISKYNFDKKKFFDYVSSTEFLSLPVFDSNGDIYNSKYYTWEKLDTYSYDRKSVFYYLNDSNGNYVLDSNGNKIRNTWYNFTYGIEVNTINMSSKDAILKDEYLEMFGNEDSYNDFISYQYSVVFDSREYHYIYEDPKNYKYEVDNLKFLSLKYESISGEIINVKINSGNGINGNPQTPDDDFDLLDFLLQILDWIINHPYHTLAIILCFIFLPTILAIISSLSPSLFASIVSIVKIVFKILLYPLIFILKLLWKIIVKIFKPSKKENSKKKIKKKKNKKFDSSLSLRSKL